MLEIGVGHLLTPVLEKKVEKHVTTGGHVAEPKSKSGTERRMEARRPTAKTEKSRGGGADSRRGSSAQNLRSAPDDTPKSTKSDSRPERRRTTPVTRAASATGRLPSQSGVRRSRSQETPGSAVASAQKAPSAEEDQAGNIRSLEAQVASFRTRNAALEGEVAQLRAEAQAMRKGQDDEIQRLRQELRNKEAQLQQKELEVKKLQAAAAEQHHTVHNFLRRAQVPAPAPAPFPQLAVSGSMTLPAGVTPFTSPRCATPRLLRPAQTLPAPTAPTTAPHPAPAHAAMTAPHVAVQVYTAPASCQLRPGDAQAAQAAQVLSFASAGTHRAAHAAPSVTSVRLTSLGESDEVGL
eukprot:s604_g22.t1